MFNAEFRDYLGVLPVRGEDGLLPAPRVEGFRRDEMAFGSVIRVSVHANRALEFLQQICARFDAPVSFVLEVGTDLEHLRVYQSQRTDIQTLLERLEPFLPALLHDGNLAFGIGSGEELEVFLTPEKVFRLFGSRCDALEQFLVEELAIPPLPDRGFPDEEGLYQAAELHEVARLYASHVRDPQARRLLEDLATPRFRLEVVVQTLINTLGLTECDSEDEPIYFSDLEESFVDLLTRPENSDEDLH